MWTAAEIECFKESEKIISFSHQDYADTSQLLSAENVDRGALEEYVKDAVEFATEGQLPDLEFSLNSHGESDVAIIDFTNMYAAENSCRAVSRHGYSLLIALAGDSLLEVSALFFFFRAESHGYALYASCRNPMVNLFGRNF